MKKSVIFSPIPLKSIHEPLGVVNPRLRMGDLIFVFLLYPFHSYFHQPLLSRVHFVLCMPTSLLQYRSDNLKCRSSDLASLCNRLVSGSLLCGFEAFTRRDWGCLSSGTWRCNPKFRSCVVASFSRVKGSMKKCSPHMGLTPTLKIRHHHSVFLAFSRPVWVFIFWPMICKKR